MTCLFSNDFSNATKSSNLAVRHFKGEGAPPSLRPTRVCLVQYLIKNDLDFRQSSSTKWYYNQDISRWKPTKVRWRLQQKMCFKVKREKGWISATRFCRGCCPMYQFCKSKQLPLESHFDQMSSKHKIAFDLSKPETESRDRKRDPIQLNIFNLNQRLTIFCAH